MDGTDPNVGQVFEDLDPRSRGRRIRVVERVEGRFGLKYRVASVNAYGERVGAVVRLTPAELVAGYRREERKS